MIATNFRKYTEAQNAQMELDLVGTIGASEKQRECNWQWMMTISTVIKATVKAAPEWFKEQAERAKALAREIKAAYMALAFKA